MRTGELGFWWRSLGGPPTPRPPLREPIEADVAVVGAGCTGLWTAYYLARADPSLRIVVLERETAGYGASGRNGGWVSGFFSGPARTYERRVRRGSYAALQRAMLDTVGEVEAVLARHAIEADFVRGGHVGVALNRAQLTRLRAEIAEARDQRHGLREEDIRELSGPELSARVRVAGALGASFTPHVARVHPAKLVLGLADAVEALGVEIYERTAVGAIGPHEALTTAGRVRARWVVRATEGYTADLPGLRRALVPINSSMIVTEPLPTSVWDQIGWEGCETLSDAAHVYVYLQRTADGRVAIGGRGVPYRFGSRNDGDGATARSTVASLNAKLVEMLPALSGARVDHAWSGVLGVARDWCPAVAVDPARGLAWAGGYVGEGVAASNLAGRTLRDLILGEPGPLTRLAWVGRAPRRWEPEPLRFGAIHAVYALYRHADQREQASGRPSLLGRLVDHVSGRA
jgi:glycine/D-amino acid oxidase-like deaminating enzyme